jgi:hypothetical protein
MSRGIQPAVLSDGGIGPAIDMLALRAAVPVELELGPVDALRSAARGGGVLRRLRGTHEHGEPRDSDLADSELPRAALPPCDFALAGFVRGRGLQTCRASMRRASLS